MILQDGDTYIVNPVMATQEVVDNELTRCIDFFGNVSFDEGSTVESFCRGIGTINGMAIQEYLDDWISWSESESTIEEGFLNDGGQELLNAGVIIKQIENLPYFEFTISGKNTYLDEDIWYEIVLNHGDKHETRTTRIKDELLRFTLVEVIGEDTEIVLFNNRKYNDLSNKKIWVETIKANTTSEINKKYRLYAWISDSTVIGNVNEDYTMEEWNDVFASIKVNVNGDFKEKELLYEEIYDITDASCFETEEITTYTHNANMTNKELNACVTLFQDEWGYPLYNDEDWESFCQGTGTWDFFTFQEYLVDPGRYYSQSELNQLEENNIIIRNETSAAITNYDENCGSDVVIPKIINGYSVTKISSSAFEKKGLTSVVIPNSVTKIGHLAFGKNLLTEVIFEENSNLIFIDDRVFYGTNQIKEVTIPNSVTHLSCTAFNDDVVINKRYSLVCVEEKV